MLMLDPSHWPSDWFAFPEWDARCLRGLHISRSNALTFSNINVKQMTSGRHKMLAWHQMQVRLALVKWNSNTFPRIHWFSSLFGNHFIPPQLGLHMSIPEFLLEVSISVHVHIYSIYTLHTTTISLMCVVFNFLFKSGENNVKLIYEIYTIASDFNFIQR